MMEKIAQNITNRDVLLILSGFAFGTAMSSILVAAATGDVNLVAWTEGFLQNFSTEMFGGFVTFLLIEVLIVSRKEREAAQRRREESRRERAERIARQKEELIVRLGSRVNAEAMRAAEELRYHEWLFDETLDDANLANANLQNVNFARARLVRVRLHRATLQEASFYHADLSGSFLVGVDAREAIFRGAVLDKVYMQGANLEGCASLTDAQLARCARLKGATMPDGARYDGRYRLYGDLARAEEVGCDVTDIEAMAAHYKVPLEVYQAGQQWADENLDALLA
ncbi:MAG: pentapeptide repeat-containing protein [Anaerolineae bacterium]